MKDLVLWLGLLDVVIKNIADTCRRRIYSRIMYFPKYLLSPVLGT